MKKRVVFSILLVGLLVATGAGASIPGANGVYTACVSPPAPSGPAKGVAVVTLLDTTVSATCPSGTSLVNWSQTGPQGPKGDKGDQGPQAIPACRESRARRETRAIPARPARPTPQGRALRSTQPTSSPTPVRTLRAS